MTEPAGPRVRAGVEQGVGTVVFDNPTRANALTLAMIRTAPQVLAGLADDDAVHAVVVRGAGRRAFVSGADVTEFAASRATPDAARAFDTALDEFWAAWASFPKPVVAALHGACVGGGLLLALLADVRVAGSSSRFAAAAAAIGAGLPVWAVDALRRAVGPAHAMEMLLGAQWVAAPHAARVGLVNHVVPDAEVDGAVTHLVRAIAAGAASGGLEAGALWRARGRPAP
jgi:enoyl-CoA hydratase